jgi:hypothetical protein
MLRTPSLLLASAAAFLWIVAASPRTPWGSDDTGLNSAAKSND